MIVAKVTVALPRQLPKKREFDRRGSEVIPPKSAKNTTKTAKTFTSSLLEA
jgi:hypothetical protein